MKRLIDAVLRRDSTRLEDPGYAKPAYEQSANKDAIELCIYLPGVDEKSVELAIEENGELVVTARRPHFLRDNFLSLQLEQRLADYRLRARLGAGIRLRALHAEILDGILRIILPTEQQARSWQVAVS
jgi:HSP20 family molecular chaperone IbpA